MAIRNNLDDIVNVDIEISTPGSSDESFNNVLLVVEGPVVGKKSTDNIGTKVISVAQTGELADYGFSTESQAYIMANVAFSQSPKPSLVYVIARQVVSDESDPVTYEKISVTLDRAKEAGGWYGIALSKAFLNKADIEETIKWTEANKKIFGFTFVEQTLPVSTTNYFRSFAVYGGGVPDVEETPDENYYIYRDKIAQVTGDMAHDVMMRKIKHHLCTYDAIGEPEEPLSETMDIKITGVKTGLFPVWLLSYKNGKRIAYAAVNGSTGKVAADIPLDIGKFLLGCLIGVIPLYFLLNLFLTVRPGVLLAFVSAIGALVTMVYCDEMEKIADVETHENDLGFFARHTLNAKKSGGKKKKLQTKKLQTKKPQKDTKRKIKNKITSFVKFSCFLEVIQLIVCIIVLFCLKFDINPFLFNWDIMGKASYVVACISCLVAIYGAVKGIVNVRRVKRKSGVMGLFVAFATILSVAVVLIKPVMDKYYYGCVLLVCAATILTLIDLVISHNRMSTRPLPQFEYKGGDHRA